jgi:hypothetical protein
MCAGHRVLRVVGDLGVALGTGGRGRDVVRRLAAAAGAREGGRRRMTAAAVAGGELTLGVIRIERPIRA